MILLQAFLFGAVRSIYVYAQEQSILSPRISLGQPDLQTAMTEKMSLAHFPPLDIRGIIKVGRGAIISKSLVTKEDQASQVFFKKALQGLEQIETIQWFINLRCVLRCDHCYLTPEQKKMPPTSYQQVLDISKKINKLPGIKGVVINGGEPFANLKLIYLALKELKVPKIGLMTSGFWAKTPFITSRVLENIVNAAGDKHLVLQVSVNEFIMKQRTKNKKLGFTLDNWVNIIRTVDEQYSKKITLVITSFYNDPIFNQLKKKIEDEGLKMPEVRRSIMEFIGPAGTNLERNEYKQWVNVDSADIFVHNKSLAIYPDGKVTVAAEFLGVLEAGNICKQGFPDIIDNINKDSLFYFVLTKKEPARQLLRMAAHFNPELVNKCSDEILDAPKIRLLLEDPILRYCLRKLVIWKLYNEHELLFIDEDMKKYVNKPISEFMLELDREYTGQKQEKGEDVTIVSLKDKIIIDWFDISNPATDWKKIFGNNNNPQELIIGSLSRSMIKEAQKNLAKNYIWVQTINPADTTYFIEKEIREKNIQNVRLIDADIRTAIQSMFTFEQISNLYVYYTGADKRIEEFERQKSGGMYYSADPYLRHLYIEMQQSELQYPPKGYWLDFRQEGLLQRFLTVIKTGGVCHISSCVSDYIASVTRMIDSHKMDIQTFDKPSMLPEIGVNITNYLGIRKILPLSPSCLTTANVSIPQLRANPAGTYQSKIIQSSI
ncbi:MAG: radical SAM protein [Candidatus Omnitrophota bacterium]